MRDDVELSRVDSVGGREQRGRGSGHHHGGFAARDELGENGTLTGDGSGGPYGVSDCGNAQRADEVDHVRAVIAAPDPESCWIETTSTQRSTARATGR